MNLPANLHPLIVPPGQLALAGPAEKLDAAHWPVRGDLAHIALAGRCFVPHYAAPMPHRVTAKAVLRRTAGEAGEALAKLGAGTGFGVLDIAGAWVWGQVNGGETACAGGPETAGLVGYLPLAALEVA